MMHYLYKKASYIAFYKNSKLSPKPSSKSVMHTGKANLPTQRLT